MSKVDSARSRVVRALVIRVLTLVFPIAMVPGSCGRIPSMQRAPAPVQVPTTAPALVGGAQV